MQRELENWREELERCFAGNCSHPIMLALQPVIQKFQIPKNYFHALIDGCEMDITQKRYETFDHLSQYCYHVASVVGLICIEIFGYRSVITKDYAVNLGMALQLTNIMRDVGEDARNGRIYLPQEDLEKFGYSEEDLLQQKYTSEFVNLMEHEDARARKYFSQALECYDKRDHHLLFPAEIMRKIYHNLLERTTAARYNVFHQRIRVPNWEKGMIAFNTWLTSRWSGATQWVMTQ